MGGDGRTGRRWTDTSESTTTTEKSRSSASWIGDRSPELRFVQHSRLLPAKMANNNLAQPGPRRRDKNSATLQNDGAGSRTQGFATHGLSPRPKRPLHTRPTVLYWNAGGISKTKFAELAHIIVKEDADIFCISEAGSHAQRDTVKLRELEEQLKGYKFDVLEGTRPDSGHRRNCGLITGVKKDVVSEFKALHKMTAGDLLEAAQINIWMEGIKTSVIMVYNPPYNIPLALEKINITTNTILVGDFNAPHKNWDYAVNTQVGEFMEIYATANALVLLDPEGDNRSTNLNPGGNPARPDLAFLHARLVDEFLQENLKCPTPKISAQKNLGCLTGLGHRVIKVSPCPTQKKQPKATSRWNLLKAKWDDYTAELEESATNFILQETKPDKNSKALVKIILSAAAKHIPRGKVKNFRPFWNEQIEALSNYRDTCRDMADADPSSETREELNQAQNELHKAIQDSKEAKFQQFMAKLDYREDALEAHRYFSELCGKKSNRADANEPLHYKSKTATTALEKANIFCRYFKSVSTPARKKKKKYVKPKYIPQDDPFNKPFNAAELDLALMNLEPKKAPGEDGVLAEFLHHSGPIFRNIFLETINNSWSGRIPSSWKTAIIHPILKKDKDPQSPASYRPIALTSMLAKTAERMVNFRLDAYLEEHNVIHEAQAGFRKNRSTLDQVAQVAQRAKEGFAKGKTTIAVSIDLSGAFDVMDRPYAIYEMQKAGVPNNIVKWLHDFVNQRRIRTVYMGKHSTRKQTLAGVAQGSITAPNTFKISTNGLARVLTSLPAVEFNKFADDELFWVTHKCEKTAATILQKALKIAIHWLEVHGFKINPSKSFYQIFTFKHQIEKPMLFINGEEVKENENGVYLGVVLDKKLSGKAHYEAAANKADKRLRLMQRVTGTTWGARKKTLALTYKSYVRPILEYGTEVFASASDTQMNILNKVQNKALRLITGAVKTTPIAAMEIYSQIEPLKRRLERRAIVLHEKLARLNPRRWLQFPTTNTKGHITFAQVATTLKEEYCPELLQLPRHPLQYPTLQSIPSPSSHIIPSLEIEGIKNKKDCSTADLQRLADAHLKKKFPLAEWVHIFTDGALNPATNRAAFSVCCLFFEESTPMAPGASIFDAEVAAIVRAAERIAVDPAPPLRRTKFVILSDNKAALQLLSSPFSCEPQSLAFKTHLVSIRSRQFELQLQWIPGHAKIRGNDKADALAKMGTKKAQPPPQAVHLSSVRTRLLSITKELVAAEHQVQTQEKHWAAEVRSGPKPGWSRKTTTAQFRLATGHDVLQHHLSRFKIVDEPATCKLCKYEAQDRAHLFRCAALQEFLIDLPDDMSKEEKEAILYWIARKKNG